MEHAKLILACVLHIVAGGDPLPACDDPFITEVSNAIVGASIESVVVSPEIMAALIYHESRFKKNARGSRGEAGLTQLLRHGALEGAYLKIPFRVLCEPYLNVHIGTAYLAKMVPKCSSPSRWLTRYNHGGSGGCVASRYSRGILADLKEGRKALATLVFVDYLSRQVEEASSRLPDVTVRLP